MTFFFFRLSRRLVRSHKVSHGIREEWILLTTIWVKINENIFFFFCSQTFHTPSFGDEEFDIPPINPHQQQQQQSHQGDPQNSPNLTYQQLHPQQNMNMNEYQQQQQYQQYNNQNSYMTQGSQMMMLPQQPQQQMMMQQQQQGVYIRSPTGNSPPVGHETTTTSEDSDDSTPHPAMVSFPFYFSFF